MQERVVGPEQAADADLAALATAGDLDAFEELYRRHVDAAWHMALAVTANPHDAADAVSDAFTRVFQALPSRPQAAGHFLPYLLAAVRNAAIDGLRRSARQRTLNAADQPEWASLGAGPGDHLVADVEAALVARAFRSLPERWRSVLWLTEVEEIPAREVAELLGLSPNGVAQLAVRARAALRQRYLQAHLRQNEVRKVCRDTVSRLGAYAMGGLAPRDLSKVDQHLAGCEDCRSRLVQLQEVTPSLHRSVLPLPAALAALSAAKWHVAFGGTAAGTAAASATAAGAVAPASFGLGAVVAAAIPAPLMATMASAALLVAGFVGAGVVEHRQHRAAAAYVTATAPPVSGPRFAAASTPAAQPAATGSYDVARLVDETARSALGVPDVTSLVDQVGAGLSGLPATPEDLAAAGRGDVHVDVGAAAAGVDLRKAPQTCPSFRVLGVRLDCDGIIAAPVVLAHPHAGDGDAAPTGGDTAAAPGAPTAVDSTQAPPADGVPEPAGS